MLLKVLARDLEGQRVAVNNTADEPEVPVEETGWGGMRYWLVSG
jgi:hypothetical protein